MPLLRRVSSVLLVALLLVLSGACGHRAYRVVTRPPDRACEGGCGAIGAPQDPIGRLRAVRAAYTALTTTTTTSAPPTTVPVTRPHLVVPPRPQAGPTPDSAHRCTGTVETEIQAVFGQATPWASSIAWRESRCTPTARNPSGSSGLFQLLLPLHDDLFQAAGCQPSQWMVVACAVRAAYLLYEGSGTRPWR